MWMHMCAAVIAVLQEWAPGKLLLYGGLGGDGKPLNDAWLLDLEHNSWELQYMASSDLCPPTVSPSDCQAIVCSLPPEMLLHGVLSGHQPVRSSLKSPHAGHGGQCGAEQDGVPELSSWQQQAGHCQLPGHLCGHGGTALPARLQAANVPALVVALVLSHTGLLIP